MTTIIIIITVLFMTALMKNFLIEIYRYSYLIKKGKKGILSFPSLIPKPNGEVTIKITKEMLYITSICNPGVNKLFGFCHGWVHYNSWRIGFRNINDKFDIVLYVYNNFKSPQTPQGFKENLISFNWTSLKKYINKHGSIDIPLYIIEEENKVYISLIDDNNSYKILNSISSHICNDEYKFDITTPKMLRWLRFENRPNLKCKQNNDILFYINTEKLYYNN